jgi:hypothetical protein
LRIRVVVGTSPEGKIESPQELFPTQKILDDVPNLETTTELFKIYPYRVCNSMMSYLRSVLSNNFIDEEDHGLIMISCPRILRFELLVIEFAQNLIE